MTREAQLIPLMMALIVMLSFFASYSSAASTITGSGDTSAASDSAMSDVAAENSCSARFANDLKARLKCRIETKERGPDVPEACRRLANTDSANAMSKQRCRALYQNIQSCYNMDGREKDRCFKLKTGFATSTVSGGGASVEKKEAARQYLVTLLYELEERVADRVNDPNGDLTAEEAADLLTHITSTKEAILQGKSGAEIRPMIQDLKVKWRATFNAQAESDE